MSPPADNFDFGFDTGIDRSSVLLDAARLVDEGAGHLGQNDETDAQARGNELRALLGDKAEWGAQLEAHEITDADFLARQLAIPVLFKSLAKDFRFVWVRLPAYLVTKVNWGFSKLIVHIEFNPELGLAGGRPRAYQILPDRKFQTLLQAQDHLDIEVGIDSNFKLNQRAALPTEALGGQATASIGVEGVASGGFGAVVGPFSYRIVRAKIEHTDTGLENVQWKFMGQEFFQETLPTMVVIVQIPRQTSHLNITAKLAAYRYFNVGSAGLFQFLTQLPSAVYNFLVKDGAPLYSCRIFEFVGERSARARNCV